MGFVDINGYLIDFQQVIFYIQIKGRKEKKVRKFKIPASVLGEHRFRIYLRNDSYKGLDMMEFVTINVKERL